MHKRAGCGKADFMQSKVLLLLVRMDRPSRWPAIYDTLRLWFPLYYWKWIAVYESVLNGCCLLLYLSWEYKKEGWLAAWDKFRNIFFLFDAIRCYEWQIINDMRYLVGNLVSQGCWWIQLRFNTVFLCRWNIPKDETILISICKKAIR